MSTFYSTAGGASDVIPGGGLYRGVVTEVGREEPLSGYRGNVGSVKVFVKELGATFRYVPIVRGPETNPYVKDDQVICAFLENRLEEVVILGRINRLPLERMVGINVEEPAYPVHIGGQTTPYGVTLKIDPTSDPTSNRASIMLGDNSTIMGTGGVGAPLGDWYVYDEDADLYNLYHTGHSEHGNGGLTIRGTGTHTLGVGTGTHERNLQFIPSYDQSGFEYAAIFGNNANSWLLINRGLYTYNHLPYQDNQYDLGYNSGGTTTRWQDIHLVNSPSVTSDQNEKTEIVDSDLGLDFINALRPVSFKWIDRGGGEAGIRTHYGLLGQEVETVLGAAASDTALWMTTHVDAKDAVPADDYLPGQPAVEEHDVQGLRYSELIAPMIKAIQELTARIEALED